MNEEDCQFFGGSSCDNNIGPSVNTAGIVIDPLQIVKIEKSQVMVDAIKKAGGNVKFTVYHG